MQGRTGLRMATANPNSGGNPEPELNLLLPKGTIEGSLWKSLFQNLDDFFFPKKLPPLQLESKPIPVRDIWGFYNYKKNGVLGSTVLHVMALCALIGGTILARRMVQNLTAPKEVVTLIMPSDEPVLPSSKEVVGGGGGGGDRDKFQALKGKLPKFSMEQIAPPQVVVRNEAPKLQVEPTVIVPPQVKISMNMPNLGDPTSAIVSGPPSNGVGSGQGPGVGEGRGGGIGGGVFHVGGGVSAPRAVYAPEPEYSEEARKAKYQGTCVLSLVVGADGRPRDMNVTRSLGLGLDEKALQTVKTWKFEPALKDGKPVAVLISVEVEFRLY